MATDKIIKADSHKRKEKTFNVVSFIALCFIVLTASFMVWQNIQLTNQLSEKEIVATAFAEGIQSMCTEESIQDRYSRMCTIATNYANESQYLSKTEPEEYKPRDIIRIDCEKNQTILVYSDGTEAVTDTKCNTTDE